jgi:hypothetical protein
VLQTKIFERMGDSHETCNGYLNSGDQPIFIYKFHPTLISYLFLLIFAGNKNNIGGPEAHACGNEYKHY